jgi:manganese/iron transport system permease protein
MSELLVPFAYDYMVKAIWVSALVGGTCAFLSAYLMLKGWSLMGDALGHSIVPGVAAAYLLKLPYAAGAFFAAGLLLVSINPTSVSIQSIALGNILGISDEDAVQVVIISAVTLTVLLAKWKDLMLLFFDESQARAVGLRPTALKVLFFALLSATTVAALQTVGACLVIAMVVTPGATAYLLTDRFGRLLATSVAIGAATSALGAYLSYFLDGATGGVIVVLQTLVFLAAFVFAPTHGLLAGRRKARAAAEVASP